VKTAEKYTEQLTHVKSRDVKEDQSDRVECRVQSTEESADCRAQSRVQIAEHRVECRVQSTEESAECEKQPTRTVWQK
jgi:hypothetical protein